MSLYLLMGGQGGPAVGRSRKTEEALRHKETIPKIVLRSVSTSKITSDNKPRKHSFHSHSFSTQLGLAQKAEAPPRGRLLLHPMLCGSLRPHNNHMLNPAKAHERTGPSRGQSWDLKAGPSGSESCAVSPNPQSTWTGRRMSPPLPTKRAVAPDPKLVVRFLLAHSHWYTILTACFVVKHHNC